MKLSPKMKCLDVKPKCSKQYPKKYGENTGKNMDVATFNKKCIFIIILQQFYAPLSRYMTVEFSEVKQVQIYVSLKALVLSM